MSEELVTLTIDGIEVSVPKGTMIVDAAKKVGIEIPVFCYHPKMHPVGMCRMCLVEVGRPAWDRTKNEPVLDEDGKPVIQSAKGGWFVSTARKRPRVEKRLLNTFSHRIH
jgi:NADH-quinone oxidoreductase subunit G